MKSFKDLIVWQKSVRLVVFVYQLTARFPKSETFGLASQMRRASVSIPSNLAEGYARKHRQEFIQFVRIAFGSGAELETQLFLAQELGFVGKEELKDILVLHEEVMKMLNKLISSLVASR